MKLSRLLDLAYMCEYVELDEFGDIKEFEQTWSDLLDTQLEDLHLSRLELEKTGARLLKYRRTEIMKARLTSDDIETIRIHLSAIKETLCNQHRWEEAPVYQDLIDRFMEYVSDNKEEE